MHRKYLLSQTFFFFLPDVGNESRAVSTGPTIAQVQGGQDQAQVCGRSGRFWKHRHSPLKIYFQKVLLVDLFATCMI